MSFARLLAAAAIVLCGVAFSPRARARPPAAAGVTARFALIIGVNHSRDADAALLRFADDDAGKYQALFRGLGPRTYLLSRLDENTNRAPPQEARRANEPTGAGLCPRA